jgi:23S rRNA (uracil1939-C5)-methyltransferase
MKLKIEKLIFGGSGLGRAEDGRPVFVRKSVPGDMLEVSTLKDKKSYSEAVIQKIVEPSSERITAKCPYFDKCGGCDHQNITYKNQLKFKNDIIKEFIDRNRIVIEECRNIVPGSDSEFFYRNSIRFEFLKIDDQLKIARHNYIDPSKPVVTDFCLLQSEFSNKLLNKILDLYNGLGYDGNDLWQVKLREGKQTGEFMLEMITQNNNLPFQKELVDLLKRHPEVKSAYHTIAPNKDVYKLIRKLIFGRPVIYEKIGNFTFQISPESFFQTNSLGVKNLYDIIKSFADIKMGDRVLDLYSGTGSIGVYLSTLAKEVVGVESVAEAVKDAKDNARINKVINCSFILADAGKELNNFKKDEFDVIIVDPPRAGLKPEVIEKLTKMSFKRLIYVSCDPATFFRDIKLFNEKGIILKNLQPVDMFPQTHHIELVGLLTKT